MLAIKRPIPAPGQTVKFHFLGTLKRTIEAHSAAKLGPGEGDDSPLACPPSLVSPLLPFLRLFHGSGPGIDSPETPGPVRKTQDL